MNIAIIGTRTINNNKLVEGQIANYKFDKIISGGARGVDTTVKNYAIKNNIPLQEILPDYKKYGRAAPIIRNKQIIKSGDFILIFWDNKSRGTKFCIEYAKKLKKEICLILVV